MSEAEGLKEWYVTREGKQYGPVSLNDLKAEAKSGELNPRLDMIWKEGMEEWKSAGKVDGIFEKNAEAEAEEIRKATPPPAPTPKSERATASEMEEYLHEENEYTEGTSRGGYIFICYILPLIIAGGLIFGSAHLQGLVGEKWLPIAQLAVVLIIFIFMISVTLNRFLNLGMTRLWFLGLIVPFLNYWLGYRLFACPAGYAEHKKLGGLGWFLAFVYWLPLLAAIGLGVFAGMKGPEAMQKMMEDGLTKMGVDIEELQKNAAEEAPEESTPPAN
ncbi:MAG: GYF domain-containing protein [Akkermansiaceae bacterium]